MQVTHPKGYWNGNPPENVFFVTDEMGTQVGTGYVVYQYQPHLYPDCPVNIFYSMDGQPSGQYMLFGALIARARQLRDLNPGERARVYTCYLPEERDALAFCEHSGMDTTEEEVMLRLTMPQTESRIPMSCAVEQTPLNTFDEQQAFVARLQQNDVTHIDLNWLSRLMFTPHFHAIGLFCNAQLIGEAVFAGSGESAELIAVYVTGGYRRQGMATALIHRCMAVLAAEGVVEVTARFITRSLPQMGLARAFHAQRLGTSAVFPGLFL